MRRVRRIVLAVVIVAAGTTACRPLPVPRAGCSWDQWGGGPAHTGQVCGVGQVPVRELAHTTIDQFAAQEQAEANGSLLTHYQVPLLDQRGDVFVLQKLGKYVSCDPPDSGVPAPCGPAAWSSVTWAERALAWTPKGLVYRWTFSSDWKPPPLVPAGWEETFQPALSHGSIYIPGAGGTLFQVDARSGRLVRRIKPFGARIDRNIYVSGGVTADRWGNVYYNALQLDAVAPWAADAHGWLVRVAPTGHTTLVDYRSLIPGAPKPTDQCYLTFSVAVPKPAMPWPPSAHADGSPTLPPHTPCLSQRPAISTTPAIGPDGTIFLVSRSHVSSAYSYLVALHRNLHLAWASTLRGRLSDGCGVSVPFGTETADCRVGARVGIDPRTNLPPAGAADDISSASPVALPDGGVLYGANSTYNGRRGHLMKFDRFGRFRAAFDFGWDITPAVYRHGSTYSVVIKDNHYGPGPFFITQLDRNLNVEWQFRATNTKTCTRLPNGTTSCTDDGQHPNGFEWCINAPAVDDNGTVYVTSEDGNLFVIGQGGIEKARYFLSRTVLAAYTPIALDTRGRIYAMNNGQLFVLGRR